MNKKFIVSIFLVLSIQTIFATETNNELIQQKADMAELINDVSYKGEQLDKKVSNENEKSDDDLVEKCLQSVVALMMLIDVFTR